MDVDIMETRVKLDESVIAESPATIREQVREYAAGDRKSFDLTVQMPNGIIGKVMAAMTEIPYGETRSYREIATNLDTAAVAVGHACAGNPVPIVVPCHRVVGTDGALRRYSAEGGVATKRQLLNFESQKFGKEPVQPQLSTDL